MALTAEEKRQRRAAASASDRRAEADRSKRRRKNEDEVARQQDRKRRQRRRVEIMKDAEADDDYANMVLDNAAARAHACRQRLRRALDDPTRHDHEMAKVMMAAKKAKCAQRAAAAAPDPEVEARRKQELAYAWENAKKIAKAQARYEACKQRERDAKLERDTAQRAWIRHRKSRSRGRPGSSSSEMVNAALDVHKAKSLAYSKAHNARVRTSACLHRLGKVGSRFVDEAARQLADSTCSEDAVVAEVTSSDAQVTHGAVVVVELQAAPESDVQAPEALVDASPPLIGQATTSKRGRYRRRGEVCEAFPHTGDQPGPGAPMGPTYFAKHYKTLTLEQRNFYNQPRAPNGWFVPCWKRGKAYNEEPDPWCCHVAQDGCLKPSVEAEEPQPPYVTWYCNECDYRVCEVCHRAGLADHVHRLEREATHV